MCKSTFKKLMLKLRLEGVLKGQLSQKRMQPPRRPPPPPPPPPPVLAAGFPLAVEAVAASDTISETALDMKLKRTEAKEGL